MMKRPAFEIIDWTTSGNELLTRSRKVLSDAPSDKVRELAGSIPTAIVSQDSAIEVVIAGQYGAGKSTILKALTGKEDIVTGAGITTEKVHAYKWNGVTVIDTPGVHTVIRPDHDEITYRAISGSDLLVFVITNELFDSNLAAHFRHLAIEREKCHEMMLVVNKMRRCARGNSHEAQNVIREDLRKVLIPLSPEQLHISFIDAESALESKVESDLQLAESLWKKSGFDPFIQELNNFVRKKGLTGRYTTSLYTLEQVLQEALAAESTGDKDVDALKEIELQRRRALLESEKRIPSAVQNEIQKTSSNIREEGRNIADLIKKNADQKKVDGELKAAQDRVQKYAEDLKKTIQEVLGREMKNLDTRIEEILNSELAKELLQRLNRRIEQAGTSQETIKNSADISKKLGDFLIRHSFKSNAGSLGSLFKLNQYSGTNAHEAIKTIAHLFGKSFKPWEAVKWARIIANAGRILIVVGAIVQIIMQYKEDVDAEQLERDLRESRSAVRSGFNDAANEIEMHFDKATQTFITETFGPAIKSVDDQLRELNEMQESRNKLFQDLDALLRETRDMIRELHKEEQVLALS